MAYRKNVGGRPIVYPEKVKTARDLMRRHLREEGLLIKDFSLHMGFSKVSTMYDYFYRVSRPLPVQIIEGFIEFVKLDKWDAQQLRWHGALESGWQLDQKLLQNMIKMEGR